MTALKLRTRLIQQTSCKHLYFQRSIFQGLRNKLRMMFVHKGTFKVNTLNFEQCLFTRKHIFNAFLWPNECIDILIVVIQTVRFLNLVYLSLEFTKTWFIFSVNLSNLNNWINDSIISSFLDLVSTHKHIHNALSSVKGRNHHTSPFYIIPLTKSTERCMYQQLIQQ